MPEVNTTPPENPFAEFLPLYANDAYQFVVDVLGAQPDDKQKGLLDAVSRGERRVSVRSGHGVGKTTVLAWLIVWWVMCKFPQKTVCTAPTSGQLFDALAAETVTWLRKLPPAVLDLLEIKTEEITLKAAPTESFVAFKTSRPEVPEALAGVHSPGFVLLIADEASGVPSAVFEAASGSMSGHNACTILAGNPVRSQGLFYDTFHKLADMWYTIHISCVGHPRISPDFVGDMARRYGEDSNAYRVRVLGEFPRADNDAVFPRELVNAALSRDVKPLNVRPIWGIDVGGGGESSDRSTLAKRRGNVLLEPVKTFAGLEPMQLVGRIKAEWDMTLASERPEEIIVDSIGIGAPVVTRLQELKLPARGVNVGELPALREQYVNLKTELSFLAREWFFARECNIAKDEELAEELGAISFLPPTSGGKLRVEPKDKTKSKLTPPRSPDLADAFIITFAGLAVSAAYGDVRQTTQWAQPLKREIKGIV